MNKMKKPMYYESLDNKLSGFIMASLDFEYYVSDFIIYIFIFNLWLDDGLINQNRLTRFKFEIIRITKLKKKFCM